MGKMSYAEQLKHPNWQRKRLETLKDAGWACEICEATDVTLHVHHRRYIKGRMVWEYDSNDLQALCVDCHEAEHAAKKTFDLVLHSSRYIGYGAARKPELLAAALLAGFTRQCVGGSIDDEAYLVAEESEPVIVWLGAIAAVLSLLTDTHKEPLALLIESIFTSAGLTPDGPVKLLIDGWRENSK